MNSLFPGVLSGALAKRPEHLIDVSAVASVPKRFRFFPMRWICAAFTWWMLPGCVAPTPQSLDPRSDRPELIFRDDFKDLSHWLVEQQQGGNVTAAAGRLRLDVAGGCTVWLRQELRPPFTITYQATMVQNGGPNDRVSDLNCFWLATDPRAYNFSVLANSNQRTGAFADYDSLRLYYVGIGGNNNTTTRFRRYLGNGDKPLLPEHDLRTPAAPLQPNRPYRMRIITADGRVQVFRDEEKLFDWKDSEPLARGWFAFRTVESHIVIEDFRIFAGGG